MKIRWHLMMLVAAALVPVLIFGAVMIVERRRQEREDVERGLLDTARALSLAVDRELEISIRALQTLGTSEHLESGDLGRFYAQAGRVLKAQGSWSTIVVFDSEGRQVLNLLRAFGSPLPGGPPSNPGVKNTIALKRPFVSNLFFGRLAGERRIAVNVPVMRDGEVKYVLGANISPLALQNLLKQQNVAPGWLATIIDANKLTLARTRDAEKFFGKAASSNFAAKTAEAKEAIWRGVTLDGDEVYGAAVRSEVSGWAVGLAAPVAVVEGPMQRVLLVASLGGISLLFMGIFLAVVFGRRIAGPIAALSKAAAAVGRGETPKTETSPIAEANQVARALEDAAVSRARAERQTRENLDRIAALRDIGTAITSSLDLRKMIAVLLEKIEIFLPIAAICAVRLLDRATGKSEFLACRGVAEEEWRSSRIGVRFKEIVETGKPLAIVNLDRDPRTINREIIRKHGLVSYLGVPLTARGEVLGVLSLYTAREHEFTAEEIEFFNTLAGEAAIAIQNAQLFEKVDLSRRELALTNDSLKASRDELERANRVKDDFLSVMSHELRTPLSIVMGYVGMMKERIFGDINPRQADVLQKVISRAAEQLDMINDIMQTTQLEARPGGAYREPFDLRDFLNHLKSDYKMNGVKNGVALIWDFPEVPTPIRADLPKLKQILQNLINNALKFTDAGTVKVTARPNGRLIEFTVSDTGVGIAADKLDLIFNKFFQVDSSETRLYGGVGLGLFIVKKFTGLLRGEVTVESEPGKGSRFTVRIPCAP
jgi:signal transduction histidine kinase